MTEIHYQPVTVERTVPVAVLPRIREKLAKLNARIAKLACPTAALTLVGDPRRVTEVDESGWEFHYDVQDVTVTGYEANIAGWTFVASLDHTLSEVENLVARFPGHEEDELPAGVRTAPANCDHCGLDRLRHTTLLIRNEAGEFRQIGKACAAEYLGIDPANALWLTGAVSDFTNDDETFYAGRTEVSVIDFVAAAAELVAQFGYVKAGNEAVYGTPTRDAAYAIARGGSHEMKRWADEALWDWKRGQEAAEAALAWIAAEEGTSEYIANLRLAAAAPVVTNRTQGLLASLPTAHARAIGRLAEIEARKAERAAIEANAQPVPVTADRVAFSGTVVGTKAQDTQFGTTYKMIVLDDRGFKVYGTIPSAFPGRAADMLGKRVAFQAKVEVSHDDPKFGFFSRPTKATIEEVAQ